MELVPEEWRDLRRFQGYKISNYATVVDWKGNIVQPYLNADGVVCMEVSRYEWSFNGPLWNLMLRAFWLGNILGVEFVYADGNPQNLYVGNLIPMARDSEGRLVDVKWRYDEQGNMVIDRRISGRRVKIVETGQEFDTVRELAEAISGNATSVYAVLRGMQKSHRGFTFESVV